MAAGSMERSIAEPRRLGVARALVEGSLVEGDVEIAGGRISDAGLSPPGSGMAIPGLVDIQVNGYAGVDVAGTDVDGLTRLARALAADGVLTYCPTVTTAPGDEMVDAVRTIAEARGSEAEDGARIGGVHIEGPFLAPERGGVHPRDQLRDPDRDLADRLLAAGPVAIFSLAPELPGALPLIAHLAERGVVVSAAHSDATAAQAVEGFAAGVRATTHTWNGMRPLRHRDPGIVGAALADPHVHIGLIGDGVHVSREVLAITWRAAADRICLVTDAVAAARAPDGRYRIGDVVIERRDGRVLDLEGRVGGGTTPLLEAVRMAVGSGIPVERAVAAASSVPATLLGLPEAGVLRVGGRADVLVVSDELELQAVLIGGREIAHGAS
jgi:N-acetylglucosamine-6-phosphate deacetylase